ncbi:DUF255 domain-containing protein [Fontivita pretiosa]|uniref:DUF255 domain-containing protein n=1 Tax=Fontivita pretiosa TaxID=2989684 RepID=UPI003D184F68
MTQTAHTNRLANETSPYLLQHAHNPVDWYPWGPEAFEAARTQDKPIFLSVGYSTCYWCHVMERESFENEAVAREMNQRFINIKVDREERPDVDQLYMTAVQVLTQQGGWPMSVFLLPDLRPFYGGTYFPPTDAYGRPGFVTLLRAVDDAYRNRRADVHRSAEQLLNILRQLAEPPPASQRITINWEQIDELVRRSIADYDPVHGGFGGAPKFPRQTLLEMLLMYLRLRPVEVDPQSQIASRQAQILSMVRHTLDAMANGGIRDHLGGGFHRYSTDAQWLVPHFEIMLYDNAMLAWCYLEAYEQTEELRYARIARGILDFVLREMTSPQGAFYTAFDAEVDAREGGSYLWTAEQVQQALEDSFTPEQIAEFMHVYGLDRGPNFADPHHGAGRAESNVLYLPDGAQRENDPMIVKMREALYQARRKRKQPLLDTKIITSWNALMIRALAYAGQVLQEQHYLDAAERAARFLVKHHMTEEGALYRTSRDGRPRHEAFLDDYAFLCQAMLALHDAGGDESWRDQARALAKGMQYRFGDEDRGGFYFTSRDAKDLIVRQKVATDSPLPSGNAVAAMVALELGDRDSAARTLSVFAQQLLQQVEAMSSMLEAAMLYVDQHGELTVEPTADAHSRRPMSLHELAERVVTVDTAWRSPTELELRLQILPPFHINSNAPAGGMIPTEVRVPDAQIETIEYPPGQTWAGQTSIVVRFKQPATQVIHVALRYQACDESACLPEITRVFDVRPA